MYQQIKTIFANPLITISKPSLDLRRNENELTPGENRSKLIHKQNLVYIKYKITIMNYKK